MLNLFYKLFFGYRRIRIPQNVLDAFRESGRTSIGMSQKEMLAYAPTDYLIEITKDFFDGEVSESFLIVLKDDLDSGRGEIFLVG